MSRTTRRGFLATMVQGAGVAGAGLVLPNPAPWTGKAVGADRSASSRVRFACVGARGMAWNDLRSLAAAPNAELAAVCDVDRRHWDLVSEEFPEARRYQYWQEMFDREEAAIDAVCVSVPDHMHGVIAARVLEMGKHLYCQKPLARWIDETRRLTEMAAARPEVVTQLGIQHHSGTPFRIAVQILRDGVLGKIKRVHAWSNKPWAGGEGRPEGEDPVPEELDWQAWLGVAPARPYVGGEYHPGKWRNWRDFGCGLLGDMAAHVFDPIVTGLGLGAARTVLSEGPEPDVERWPAAAKVQFTFDPTPLTHDERLRLTWYDGQTMPDEEVMEWMPEGLSLPETGSMLIGEKGAMLLPHVNGPLLLPRGDFRDYAYPEVEPDDHYEQFVAAIRGERQTRAPFSYGGPLTELVLAGTVAQHMRGKELAWNAETARFDSPQANQYLTTEHRRGWDER